MFDIPVSSTAIHRFARDNDEALQNAAHLLGAKAWLCRAKRLLDEC